MNAMGPGKKEQQNYEAEDAMNTMMRAQKIKNDGPMMRRVKRLAMMKAKEMEKMAKGMRK